MIPILPTLVLVAGAGDAAFPPNRLFVSQIGQQSIAIHDPSGASSTFAPASSLGVPFGIAFGPDGAMYVADGESDRVLVFDAAGSLLDTIGADGELVDPRCITFGPGGEIYVSSATGVPLTVFSKDGTFDRTIGAQFGVLRAEGVLVTPNGHVFVASQRDDQVYEFDPSGAVVDRVGGNSGLDDPIGLALGRDGNLYVASENTHEVIVYAPDGGVAFRFGPEFGLQMPIDLEFGPDDRLYVVCFDPNLVHVFTVHETKVTAHTTIAVPGNPGFLAFSPFHKKAELEGDLTRPGEFAKGLAEKCRLTYAPGAGTIFVTLDPGSTIAAALGSEVFVFAGADARVQSLATKRQFVGQQVPSFESDAPSATIGMRIVTQPDPFGSHEVMKSRGSFDASLKGSIFRGEIRTKP